MNKTEMIETLTKNLKELEEVLKGIEAEFNLKKSQYLKIQGALEALNELKED